MIEKREINQAMEGQQQQRRSSSRSIKRKKFDDELVESSISYSKAQRSRSLCSSLSVSAGKGAMTSLTSPLSVTVPASPTIAETSCGKRQKLTSSKRKRHRNAHNYAVKDIGRWKPQDDLALVLAVQQTNDLESVYRAVKFSCKFSLKEIEYRWYALLYDATIAKIAVSAMRQLHPDVVAQIHSKALFNEAEEQLLKKVAANSQPTLETFQELINENADVFLPYRSSKSLMSHWSLLKHYHLLYDQSIQTLSRHEDVINFSDAEEAAEKEPINITQSIPHSATGAVKHEDVLHQEMMLADRKNKREIRQLENEIPKWQVLVDSITGVAPSDFDSQTLAVLRGRLVRYLMRSREITLGRCAKDSIIDVDLSLEGPASKISRKQGLIKLHSNGDFMIVNTGKRPFYVDSKPILGSGNCAKLNNNSVVEIAGLRFVFLINQDLIAAVRAEALKKQMCK
ncbi:microspherule protein 1-like isoform X2 [Leptotrombidium deliense]|uniref:Microspherule protein 1 n=1 Tax=Leptotrombidium deliense TaxID=299467 RepID=A0A443SNE0_9ACAR|nr:microspherule protein 1-like isoform X2 [Leptotrombidium deliense]